MTRKKGQKGKTPFSIDYKWALGAILVLTIWVYSNSLDNAILNFDDNQYFEDYPEITDLSWENVGKYFSNHYVLMYHPLPILTFAINYNLTGLEPQPLHAVNLIFHLLNVVLAFFFFRRILGNVPMSLLLAAIWAVHPMNTEAVSWISARSSVMYSCFFLAGLLCYFRYQDKREWKWYGLALVFCVLSLLSKANAVVFPVVLVLFEIYHSRKSVLKHLLLVAPFLALSVGIGLYALYDSGTKDNIDLVASRFEPWEFLVMATYSLWFYVKSLVVPIDLAAIHTYPEKLGGTLPLEFFVSLGIVMLLLALVIWKRSEYRFLLGILFFGVIVSLTLQLIPSRLFLLADRYAYLPYLGLLVAGGHFLLKWVEHRPKKFLQTVLPAGVIVVFIFSGIAHDRNNDWVDTLTLVEDIIEKNPDVPYLSRAYGIKAGILGNEKGDIGGAIENYDKAIALNPEDGITYFNRGTLLYKLKNYQRALKDFKASLPLLDTSYHFRIWNEIGLCQFALEKYSEAENSYSQSVALRANFPDAYNNRGVVYAVQARWDEAINDFTAALKLNPRFVDAFRNRGLAHIKLNDRDKACADLLAVRRLGSKVADELIKANSCQ